MGIISTAYITDCKAVKRVGPSFEGNNLKPTLE